MQQNTVCFSAMLQPEESCFDAPPDLPLLVAAEHAGLLMASSCRNGTCRTCICRLASGSIRYSIAWPGLSADEKRDGYILPCVAYPTSDVILQLPERAGYIA
jgi:ferredoxin